MELPPGEATCASCAGRFLHSAEPRLVFRSGRAIGLQRPLGHGSCETSSPGARNR